MKKKVKSPAYSEIFTPIQWVAVTIFGFFAITGSNYQVLLIMALFTYFSDVSHDLPEGIHDADGDKKLGVKTYATSFGEKAAAKISFITVIISGFFGILLYFMSIL